VKEYPENEPMKPSVTYISDVGVDATQDREIRDLLTTCFTKPEDVGFKTRRYFKEPYPHRWVIRNANGGLVAHVGLHEKMVAADGWTFRIGGIAEVCVHPESRGKGYVRIMLREIDDWQAQQGFAFSMLFGDPNVYGSSGYVEVGNLVYGGEDEGWTPVTGMIKPLSLTPWPTCPVKLYGLKF